VASSDIEGSGCAASGSAYGGAQTHGPTTLMRDSVGIEADMSFAVATLGARCYIDRRISEFPILSWKWIERDN
jgi:hypothetical protein